MKTNIYIKIKKWLKEVRERERARNKLCDNFRISIFFVYFNQDNQAFDGQVFYVWLVLSSVLIIVC